ncbi:hypothetical protein OV208_25915 [Corallococcus sp. bb12-1]|uniref:hypothetical protein n=1 Tax=Corallococcus sp. bb12-1 TaxID=2996784 RepID=UPI00226DEC78|nr:hypothetical protein [Corallococcus sp. bb12-1]MCY1044778.1 hypothetical protein [Corallococcus sp. bb12-1]
MRPSVEELEAIARDHGCVLPVRCVSIYRVQFEYGVQRTFRQLELEAPPDTTLFHALFTSTPERIP